MKVKSYFEDIDQLIAKPNQQQLKTKPDKPNSLLLVVCCSLLLQDGEAGYMLPYIMQRLYLK